MRSQSSPAAADQLPGSRVLGLPPLGIEPFEVSAIVADPEGLREECGTS